jgi:WhiB family redox-sensing transcriptional regulator
VTAMRPVSLVDGTPVVEWDTGTEAELAVLAQLVTGADRPGWQWRAACAGADPRLFFPAKGGSTARAKQLCGSCGVRTECLDEALVNHLDYGVWGGLSPRERRAVQPPTKQAQRVRRAAEVRRLAAEGWGSRQLAERFGMTTKAVLQLLRHSPES